MCAAPGTCMPTAHTSTPACARSIGPATATRRKGRHKNRRNPTCPLLPAAWSRPCSRRSARGGGEGRGRHRTRRSVCKPVHHTRHAHARKARSIWCGLLDAQAAVASASCMKQPRQEPEKWAVPAPAAQRGPAQLPRHVLTAVPHASLTGMRVTPASRVRRMQNSWSPSLSLRNALHRGGTCCGGR